MKQKILLLAFILAPLFLQAQETIDRAMSVWSRDIVNANFTSTFASTTTNTTNITVNNDSIVANAADIATNLSSITSLEAISDSNYVTMTIDTATINWLIYTVPYADLSFSDSAVVNDLTQNTWQKVTNAADTVFSIVEASGITANDDTLVILTHGDYLISASLSFSGTNTDVYEFAIFKNGSLESPKLVRSTSSTDIGNVSLPFYLNSLEANDYVSLRYRNTANNNDATLIACSWVVYLLHR